MQGIIKLLEGTDIEGPTELANRSGIDRGTIYQMFGPGGNPSLNTLEKLAKATGKPVEDIVRLVLTNRAS